MPGGPAGRYAVLLTNRIESPVRITRLHGVDLGSGSVAAPLDALPIVVAPGQTATLTYQVAPADAAVPDLEPVFEASVEPAHAVLWPLLMWNQGWTSSTFPVTATIDAGYFGGAPGLTGVRVEFESDQTVTLGPGALTATVQLRMPLLGYLLKDGSATRYRYRVRNLHGDTEGAAGELIDGEGDLEVVPAPEGV